MRRCGSCGLNVLLGEKKNLGNAFIMGKCRETFGFKISRMTLRVGELWWELKNFCADVRWGEGRSGGLIKKLFLEVYGCGGVGRGEGIKTLR